MAPGVGLYLNSLYFDFYRPENGNGRSNQKQPGNSGGASGGVHKRKRSDTAPPVHRNMRDVLVTAAASHPTFRSSCDLSILFATGRLPREHPRHIAFAGCRPRARDTALAERSSYCGRVRSIPSRRVMAAYYGAGERGWEGGAASQLRRIHFPCYMK